jgi:hypothetical protein
MRSHILLLHAALATGLMQPSCVDEPLAPAPTVARLVIGWDPLVCGLPHRVALELDDEAGSSWSATAPCSLGGLAVDVSHHGVYRGRLYAQHDAVPRSVLHLELIIDEPIVHHRVATPQ